MSDPRSGPALLLAVLGCFEKAPEGSETEYQAVQPKHVLIQCHASEQRLRSPFPVVTEPHVEEVNHQDRYRYEHEAYSCKESLDGGRAGRICQDNQNHHDVAQSLEPAFERDVGKVGPQDARCAVKREQEDRSVHS